MSPHAGLFKHQTVAGTIRLLDSANGIRMPTGTAQSLMLVNGAYAGNCIKVRRDTDNTTQAIGFSSGALDQTALVAFVTNSGVNPTANGFIDTVYDQSGQGHDAIETNAAHQDQIVASGAVITHPTNGLPAAKSPDNARGCRTNPFVAYTGTAVSCSFVGAFGAESESLSPRVVSLLPSDTTQADFNTPGALLLQRNANNPQWGISRNSTLVESYTTAYNELDSVVSVINSSNYSLLVNGNSVSTGSGLSAAFSVGSIGFGVRSTTTYQSSVNQYWQQRMVWFVGLTSTEQNTLAVKNQATYSTPALPGGGTGGTTNTPDGAPSTVTAAAGGTFTRVFFDDFDTPVAAGAMINSSGVGQGVYNKWKAYATGTGDTEHNNVATASYYNNSILSASASSMVMDMHHDSASGQDWGAAPYPVLDSALSGYSYNDATTLYGRVETRAQTPLPSQGFKDAWLRWNKKYDLGTKVWPAGGETDYPEGNLNANIGGFMHWYGATSGSQQDAISTSTSFVGWHTFVDEWTPGDWRFYLDGVLIGHSTGAHVSSEPMRWIMQSETVLSTSGRPIAGQHCIQYVDYVALYTWAA